MFKKKGFIMAFILIISMIGMTACKKNVGAPEDNAQAEENEDETNTNTEETQEHLIGFSVIDMENPYFITLESAAKAELEKAGYRMITKNPETDSKLQETQIQEMIDEGIEAIILSPVDWEKITPSLQALKKAGVKIINVDTQVKEMEYVDAYIGSDNQKAGYICGEDLITKCPDGGKIAILECPTQNSINERITGFEETIAQAENGFEVVERMDTKGEFELALEAAQKILEEHPDISAIMCGNDQLAVAAKAAVNVAELDNVIIYGVDGSPDIKKELKKPENQIAGTAAQSPINMGKQASLTAVQVLNDEEYEKEVYEDVFMINRDNVDMYGTDGWQ